MIQTPMPPVPELPDELHSLLALVASQKELIEVQRRIIEAGLGRRRVRLRRWSGVLDEKNV
jgi:hypothetical protein